MSFLETFDDNRRWNRCQVMKRVMEFDVIVKYKRLLGGEVTYRSSSSRIVVIVS